MKLELFLSFYSFFCCLRISYILFSSNPSHLLSLILLFSLHQFSLSTSWFFFELTESTYSCLYMHWWRATYWSLRAPCPRGWLTFLSPSASISYQLLPRSSPIRASILAVLILCTSCACSQSCYESLCNGAGMSSIYCFSCSHQLHLALTVFWPNLNNVSWPLQGKTVI